MADDQSTSKNLFYIITHFAVYEYIPDSEEASASQAESVLSSSSMDELEWSSKTQRFLENMERMRKEIQEETETQQYEEEVIEELEIDEQGSVFKLSFFGLFLAFFLKNFHIS